MAQSMSGLRLDRRFRRIKLIRFMKFGFRIIYIYIYIYPKWKAFTGKYDELNCHVMPKSPGVLGASGCRHFSDAKERQTICAICAPAFQARATTGSSVCVTCQVGEDNCQCDNLLPKD